jgi:hypothetical protein
MAATPVNEDFVAEKDARTCKIQSSVVDVMHLGFLV